MSKHTITLDVEETTGEALKLVRIRYFDFDEAIVSVFTGMMTGAFYFRVQSKHEDGRPRQAYRSYTISLEAASRLIAAYDADRQEEPL